MMALRNTKITREVVQTCNRFLSSKAEISSITTAKAPENASQTKEDCPQFRYIVANMNKPELPKIEFPKEPEQLIPPEMRHLQPSMLPKYIELDANRNRDFDYEYTADREVHSPFPEPIKEMRTKTLTISDQKKAEMKSPGISVNLKHHNLSHIMNRSYSTIKSPFLTINRSFANKHPGKGNKDEKCEPQQKVCKKNTSCPSFIIKECEPSKGSDCLHRYVDPKCTKKMAPYPSYSESCADRLPDDPSECMQCPWSRCGGTDSIKPPKRNYHTKTNSRMLIQNSFHMSPYLDGTRCDAKKEPCKRPPGKCKKEETTKKCPDEPKKPKEPCENFGSKKKCHGNSWTTAYELWAAKENILPDRAWTIIETENMGQPVKTTLSGCSKFPYDKKQADYDHVRKRKNTVVRNPKCDRKKKKVVPDCTPGNCHQGCISTRQIIYELEKCPEKQKPKCPKVDTTIDNKLELIKEHDKGHPPPCQTWRKPSKQCPKKDEQKKQPYREQRDLNYPYYKKQREPWSEDDK